jgi:stage V sporulation protein B
MDKERAPAALIRDTPLSRKATLMNLVKIAVPVAIGSSILSILTLIDTKLILNRLQEAAGFSYEQAKVYYGVYSKVQTIFNLPSAFIVPVTISVIPAISALVAIKNHMEAKRVTEASLKLTSLLALPAGVGLAVLSYPIVNVLYPGSHSDGPVLLAILGVASFFVCLTLITIAILQAYGYERFPVYTMAVGGIIKIAITWVLTSDPNIGVRGAALGTLICYLVISLINIINIYLVIPERPALSKIFVKPIIATCVMGLSAYLSYYALQRLFAGIGILPDGRLPMLTAMSLSILTAIVIYLIMIVILKAITKEDLTFIPKGDKIAKFLRLK